jgi:hypothetical protein
MCWVWISSKENPTEHSNTEILIQIQELFPTFSSQKCLRIMVLIFLQNYVGIAKNFDQDKETLLSLQIWNSFHQTWSSKIHWKNKEWGKRQAISTLCALFLNDPSSSYLTCQSIDTVQLLGIWFFSVHQNPSHCCSPPTHIISQQVLSNTQHFRVFNSLHLFSACLM